MSGRPCPIIALRNKISSVLFEHKEHIESGVYKILYETLHEQTKHVPDEKILVSITYVKATVSLHLDENGDPEQSILQDARTRNILIPKQMLTATEMNLHESRYRTCTFHNILPTNETEAMKRYLEVHLDEEDLFNSTQCACRIIKIVQYKQ